jgi:hypothetical protein
MTSSLAEVAGCILGGIMILGTPGPKRIRGSLAAACVLPAIGAILVLLFCKEGDNSVESYFILMINLGIGASYVL